MKVPKKGLPSRISSVLCMHSASLVRNFSIFPKLIASLLISRKNVCVFMVPGARPQRVRDFPHVQIQAFNRRRDGLVFCSETT